MSLGHWLEGKKQAATITKRRSYHEGDRAGIKYEPPP